MSDSSQTLNKKADELNAPEGGKEVTLDEALELAKSHHQAGNFTIAERTYRDILNAVPDHFPTVHFLGLLCHQRGNDVEALSCSEKAVNAAPENPNVWINHGAILIANEKYIKAVEAFDEAISIEPELYGAWTNKSYALWLLDRFEEAEEAALQATMLEPEKVEGYINLGIALGAQEKFDEANNIWAQAEKMAPEEVKIYSNWSNTLRSMGALESAREKAQRAVELEADNHEALCNLANALRDLGKLEDALDAYNKATDVQPDYYQAHANKAATLIDMERYPEAITAAKYGISFNKEYAFAYSQLSKAQLGMGEYGEAYAAADQATRFEPEEPLHYIHMAEALLAMDRYDEAEAVVAKAMSFDPGEPRTLIALADVRRGLDQIDEAIEALDSAISNHQVTPGLLLKKAIILNYASRPEDALEVIETGLEMFPGNAQLLYTKADILLTSNRKDEAREIVEAAGASGSETDKMLYYMNIVSYKNMTKDDEDFIEFKKLMENTDKYSLDIQSNLQFSMFQTLERMKEYDEAFEYLKTGNDMLARMRKYDPKSRPNFAESIAEIFSLEVLEQYNGLGSESDVPVFIVGMPRSGTTLTEQIISSHHQVFGAGELFDMGNIIRDLGPLVPEKARMIGDEYVRRIKLRDKTGEALRITDKMPPNYQQIGLIKSVLPNARIIHCRRNPMDNLLSCYKQNFAQGHVWSYDLEGAAYQYIEYAKLMDHWRNVLPAGSFLEIDYEETVSDLETQARRLIDYVGLEWDDACLKPHKQKRSVLTASKNQVIKPVYKTSVEAWRRYEKQLQPMYDVLNEAGLV